MPTVPRYDTLQVTPTSSSVQGFSLPNMPDTAGHQAQQLGQALQQTGGELGTIAQDIQAQANQAVLEDVQTQAVKADTQLRIELAQLQGKNALERPDNKSLAEEYADKQQKVFDFLAQEGLKNDVQREAFSRFQQNMGQQLYRFAANHALQQHGVFLDEKDAATLSVAQERTAMLYGDPIARQEGFNAITATVEGMAQRKGWDAATRDKVLVDNLSPVHAGVIKSMLLANNVDAAQQYYNEHSANMTLQGRANVQEALLIGARNVKAQSFGDEVMGKKMTLDGALAEARSRFSGAEEIDAVKEVKERFAEAELAQVRDAKHVANTAWSEVMQSGHVTPGTLADLRQHAPEQERQIRDWQDAKRRQALAEEKGEFKTDWNTYYGLRRMAFEQPEEFAKKDLRQSEPFISKADLSHLAELQAGIGKADAKAMESQRVVKNTLGLVKNELASVGINLSQTKDETKAKEAALFLSTLTMALDQKTATKGVPLTDAEAKTVAMSLIREGKEQGSGIFGFFQNTKRGYQFMSDPDNKKNYIEANYADIPERIRSEIIASEKFKIDPYHREPSAQDKAEIERIYTRGKQQGRF